MSAAREVLDLSHRLGPAARYQLRYQNGFLVVMIHLCCSFVLKMISFFPQTVQDIPAELERIRDVADIMIDLGSNGGSSATNIADTLLARVAQISSSRDGQAIGQAGSGFPSTCSSEPPFNHSDLTHATESSFGDAATIRSDFGEGLDELNPFGFEPLDFDILLSL